MKRKEDLKTANEALTKAQAQLKAFDGIDPEAVRKLLAEQKTAEEKGLEAKGDWDRLKTRMAEEHTRTLTEQTTKLTAAEQKLQEALNTINELSIGTLFGQSKFISDELTLTPAKAKMIYASHFDLEEGKVVGYDKPRGSAGRTAQVDAYGNPVDFETAMKKIIEADPEKDYLMKSKMKPGAGSDSKKMDVKPQAGEKSGLDKITAGLKDLKLPV
jgi:hypothetical protein